MTIAPAILKEYPSLNEAQRSIIEHIDGPLLVIAGPGSGKTFSLVLRALNLLILNKVKPRELVICTFTEKAAFELRDRLSAGARTLGYTNDLSELRVSTIHGICNHYIGNFRHHTELGSNYEVLDELTQFLFVFDGFDEIIGPGEDGLFLQKWKTKWTAIEGACAYFNKITEELVDAEKMSEDTRPFIRLIAQAYNRYRQALFLKNRLDFAHQQKIFHDLLINPSIREKIIKSVKYVLVDEYQDTNYIQEQILFALSSAAKNICVVGDEDQSLYRFRGATVRNILEFPIKMKGCKIVKLTTNYRSHQTIIQAYDRWMSSADWSNPSGSAFRFDKTIQPDPDAKYPDYPAVFSIWGQNQKDEGERFANLVSFLKERDVISDYNQVALLLHSVRQEHSGHYISALEAKGIPYFCPRARAYFDNDEIRLIVACLAIVFGYYGSGRGELASESLRSLAKYVDDAIVLLAKHCSAEHPLAKTLQKFDAEIRALKPNQSLDMRPADYFYRLIAYEPFLAFTKDENRARNLAVFSQLLNTFQNYYHYTVVTNKNREYLRYHLFNSFIRLLHEGGINEYEDKNQPFPKGHVQIMTIHQAKGLEFSVIVVNSLDKQLSSSKGIDRDLRPYYHRPPFEPENRVTGFDRMRLHYVAFSRPEKLLVLTAHKMPKDYFFPIWQNLPQWPYVEQDILSAQNFKPKERSPLKRSFSFTGDLKIYETCPRQYQFFREYDFTPSRSAVIFFGLLVHQTIEEIHRIVLDGGLAKLNEKNIRDIFEKTFYYLSLSDVRPVGKTTKETAFTHILNYFNQNQNEMARVLETEVDVSVEKEGYILTGKVDLLMGEDRKLEILDFKTSPKPLVSSSLLLDYERQLCTYAHIIEKRYNKVPERLLIYWTSEKLKEHAIMSFDYRPELLDEAGRHFDSVVAKIQSRDFRILATPEPAICKECDLKNLCTMEGTIH